MSQHLLSALSHRVSPLAALGIHEIVEIGSKVPLRGSILEKRLHSCSHHVVEATVLAELHTRT